MIGMADGHGYTPTTEAAVPRTTPVVMIHGGPGVPDYLAATAGLIDELRLE